MRIASIVREAIATAWSQPVASAVSVVIVAGMVASVLLTTGRTVGSEQAVLGSIDSAGTRSIIVRAEASAGLDSTVLERVSNIDGVHWIGALGPAMDVTNADIPGGTLVPARYLWTPDVGDLGVPQVSPIEDESAWASARALEQLGMVDSAGGIETVAGEGFSVVGQIATPDYLSFLEPLVIVPQGDAAEARPIAILVIIAERPDLVAPLAKVVSSVLAVDDPTKVTISTSERLATLRALIEGQLGSFGRALVLLIFGVSALLVAAILYGLVMMRRKDFGRRRALGASQGFIVLLLIIQIAALSLFGSIVGSLVALIVLLGSGDPLPGPDFVFAIVLLALSVSIVAALLPALAAARREPIAELRVP